MLMPAADTHGYAGDMLRTMPLHAYAIIARALP